MKKAEETEISFDLTHTTAKIFVVNSKSELDSFTFRGKLYGVNGYDTIEEAYKAERVIESRYSRFVKWIKNL